MSTDETAAATASSARSAPPDIVGSSDPELVVELERVRSELAATRLELLAARDEVIGASSELGHALGRIVELEDRIAAHASAVREIRGFERTPLWPCFRLYLGVRRRLAGVRHRTISAVAR